MAQLPPFALDAERAVLSACLIAPDALATVRDTLRPEQFFDARCRLVLEAAIRIDDAGSKPDAVTLAVTLRDSGKLESIGGTVALAELLDSTPDLSNLEEHCAIVAAKDRLRKIINVCRTHIVTAYGDVGDIETYCATVEREFYEATDCAARADAPETVGELIAKAMPEITERQSYNGEKKRRVGITTGIYELDVKLGGGMDPNLYVLAGRPGMGKTALAIEMCIAVALAGMGSVFFSFEMDKEQLAMRVLSQVSRVDYNVIRSEVMSEDEWRRVLSASQQLSALPMSIQHRTGHMTQIRSTLRREFSRLKRKHGVKAGLGAIDYAQIIEGNRPKGATREEEVGSVLRFCRNLPSEFECPILLLSQLNRNVESRPDKRPQLSDLRESGAIEQDAHGIWFTYRDEYYHPETEAKGEAEIILGKNRNGSPGTVIARYDGPTMRFYSPTDGLRDACDEYADAIQCEEYC